MDISASIVLYKNEKTLLKKAINSFLNTNLEVRLYLLDNSPNDSLRSLEKLDSRITYIFNKGNLGYGSAHNIAIRDSIEEDIPYHLVLNPDIYFEEGVIEELFEYMNKNSDIGNIMPKVLYPDDKFQPLCKLLPTPTIWLGRFIATHIYLPFFDKLNNQFEMKFANFDEIMEVPYLSGCFMFLRTEALKKSGLFDENIFLHTEDTDLSRRIFEVAKNIYYPNVFIYHEHNKEAYRSKKVLLMQIKSIIYYFNKWGWFFDKKREIINKEIINKYGEKK